MATTTDATDDLFPIQDPEFHQNPYPYLSRLRQKDPVRWSPVVGGWLLSRYQDVVEATRDSRLSSERLELLYKHDDPEVQQSLDRIRERTSQSLGVVDPPVHTRLKNSMKGAFRGSAILALEPLIRRQVTALLDSLAERDSVDLLSDYAFPLPIGVICELLGVPVEDAPRIQAWSDDVVGLLSSGSPTAESARACLAANQQLDDYLRPYLLKESGGQPSDFVEHLHDAMAAGLASERECLENMKFLIVAGHETTTNLLGNGILAILSHPDQRQIFMGDESVDRSAIEELLRFDSPVQRNSRIALERVEIGGKTIEKGDVVVMLLGSANRDPDRFDCPDQLILRRPDNKHVAFSRGIHTCLGAPLARAEAAIAVRELFKRFPAIELDDVPSFHPNQAFRGLESLKVRLH